MTADPRPLASLSLDLDNLWSYQKTHGDAGWDAFPTYLDVVVPRILEVTAARGLTITVFVVGQDAADPRNHDAHVPGWGESSQLFTGQHVALDAQIAESLALAHQANAEPAVGTLRGQVGLRRRRP